MGLETIITPLRVIEEGDVDTRNFSLPFLERRLKIESSSAEDEGDFLLSRVHER